MISPPFADSLRVTASVNFCATPLAREHGVAWRHQTASAQKLLAPESWRFYWAMLCFMKKRKREGIYVYCDPLPVLLSLPLSPFLFRSRINSSSVYSLSSVQVGLRDITSLLQNFVVVKIINLRCNSRVHREIEGTGCIYSNWICRQKQLIRFFGWNKRRSIKRHHTIDIMQNVL